MHQHYQSNLTLQQEQKSIVNITEYSKFYNNILRYYFSALICEINLRNYLFFLISTLIFYLISNLLGEVLIRGQRKSIENILRKDKY